MAPPSARLGRGASAVAGVAISIGLLYWALRGVDLTQVRRHVADAHVLPLLLAVAVATGTFVIRLFRWRLLLRDDHGGPLPALPLWHAIAIGFMANNLLPFRAGELLRCLAAAKLTHARFTTVVSSIAVERVFDGLTLAVLLAVALLAADLPENVAVGGVRVARLAQGAGALAALAIAAAAIMVAFPGAAERGVRAVLPAGRVTDRVVGIIEGLRHGLSALRSPTRLAGVVLWSFTMWLVNAAAFWICFAAFDIAVGFDGALLLQSLLVLGISIPSTPGFIGPFEAAIVAALALYAVPQDRAFSYAITFHVTTFIPIVLLGFWSLARTPIGWRDLRTSAA